MTSAVNTSGAAGPNDAAAGRPVSPVPRRMRAPSWLDLRLVMGVVLVLGSVVAGARIVASSDHRSQVWQATGDLAAGTVLTGDDLRVARVQVPASAGYVSAKDVIVGQMLSRPIGEGELIPRGGLGEPSAAMTVTIPVSAADAPPVRRGDRIAVWVSTKSCRGLVVLPDVVVQDAVAPRSGGLSTSARLAITVRVEPELAERVVQALDLPSAVIRIGVLSATSGQSAGLDDELADLAACEAS